METVNQYLFTAFERYADLPMQILGDRTWTFREAAEAAHGVARFLEDSGIKKGDRIALIAENSPRWFHVYAGALAIGAVVVPRGEDIGDKELQYILQHSDAKLVFTGTPEITARVGSERPTVDLTSDGFPAPLPTPNEVLDTWRNSVVEEDLVVLLYTSGTTGIPKGVMLEHRNIAHNVRTLPAMVDMAEGKIWVSVLPSWHTFEQTVEICSFSCGCVTAYSSKRTLREDLVKYRPHFFASVPRIWEMIHATAVKALRKKGGTTEKLFWACMRASGRVRRGNPLGYPLHLLGKKLFYGKVAKVLGGRLHYSMSGGGYLPAHVDEFFANLGVTLLIGYGLTETAPVIALRDPRDNVLGTIGRAVPETELKVGPKGTFLVRGPQVMRGYYQEPEQTAAVLDEHGWLDTGDIGTITPKGDLVFRGRLKETIVLSGGENVEPEPIEQSILESPLIQQVMIVGQDRKMLCALVVPDDPKTDHAEILKEVRARSGPDAGFRSFESVSRCKVIDDPFTPENGYLTATQKKKRNVIADAFATDIDSMYR
jgi:long-chain acyl-CoA synthetase